MDLLTLALLAQMWPVYHGGPDNIKYSKLTQITPANVAKLKVAWRYDSGDEFQGSEIQCNPIVVNGVLYGTTPKLRVVALDAGTGKEIWSFDPNPADAKPRKRRNRSVTHWNGQIIFGYDYWLIRLDAKTGKEVGRIDLRQGLGREPEGMFLSTTSPGIIYQDLLIIGHLTSEDLPAAPGDIRAFDLKTGKIAWTFHTIPYPGELGHDTWPKDAWKEFGGANNWAGMALDEKRGIVFVPTGSSSFDFYGANRPGDNLFANSLLALDAKTGKRIWHFQFVKHDVWDRDLPTPPSLVQVKRNGKLIDAVAQPTKSGHLFVFNRETGESLFPLETREVPPSEVDGEILSKTQVLPLKPAPFARQMLTPENVHPSLVQKLKLLRSGDQFTPPSFEGTIIFPGFDGGAEWGGATFDPETRLLYVNANEMPWILRIIPRKKPRPTMMAAELYAVNCANCHGVDGSGSPPQFPSLVGLKGSEKDTAEIIRKGNGRMPAFSHLGEDVVSAVTKYILHHENPTVQGQVQRNSLKYGTDGYNKFQDEKGFPGVKPPWGTLTAIDLDSGEFKWRIPFGEYPDLEDKTTGSENYGGSVVTKSGLLFIAATNHDRKIRAFDKKTGKLLWSAELPASGNATPAVYEHKGKQYLVIAAGGGKSDRSPSGGSYVAFALP